MNSIFERIYSHNSQSLPILAMAVLCITATAFILVSYYIFVTKCCLNCQQFNLLRRFSITRSSPQSDEPVINYSPVWQNGGLSEFLIREIPSFQYSKIQGEVRKLFKCIVCLNEFKEDDTLRVLPNCNHGFHLDCIDIWLQSNTNCPLCRLSISGKTHNPIDRIIAPTSSPQDPQMGADEDYVVIEFSGPSQTSFLVHDQMTKLNHPSIKFEKMKTRKFGNVSIMGDECIDTREKDDQFSVQTIRRSFSMDSAADRHVYLSVQDILRNDEECGNRVRRPFFSQGSRNSILPVEFLI